MSLSIHNLKQKCHYKNIMNMKRAIFSLFIDLFCSQIKFFMSLLPLLPLPLPLPLPLLPLPHPALPLLCTTSTARSEGSEGRNNSSLRQCFKTFVTVILILLQFFGSRKIIIYCGDNFFRTWWQLFCAWRQLFWMLRKLFEIWR